jgi:hypothetical protein
MMYVIPAFLRHWDRLGLLPHPGGRVDRVQALDEAVDLLEDRCEWGLASEVGAEQRNQRTPQPDEHASQSDEQ